MSGYRRGTVLGLTVAETFILLTFLLLLALLGLTHRDEPLSESNGESAPGVWMRPEEIETLKSRVEQAREAKEVAERARAAAERARDQAHRMVAQAREAKEVAERARAASERERDRAQEMTERAREAREEAELAHAAAERERDQARRELAVLRRKGENPPCWYDTVLDDEGGEREKAYYAFNVAIHEGSIELAPSTVPPGGAVDDGGGSYADEYKRLRIEELPYGRKLSDKEFEEAVRYLAEQGRKQLVRTYKCVFFVRVWDETPDDAKKRWKDARRFIEQWFGTYAVRDREWKAVE